MQSTHAIGLRARRAETDFCISGLEQAPEPGRHQDPLMTESHVRLYAGKLKSAESGSS